MGELQFRQLLWRETRTLVLNSAFVRSGSLWGPFPALISMFLLGVLLTGFLLFGRDSARTATLRDRLRALAISVAGGIAMVVLALLVTAAFELYYAPTEVLNSAIATALSQPQGLRVVTMATPSINPKYPHTIKVILQYDQPLSLPRRFVVICDNPIGDGTAELTHIGTIYSIGSGIGTKGHENVWGATIDGLAGGGPLNPDNQVVFELSAQTPLRVISVRTSP